MFAIPSHPSPWSLKLLTGKAYTPWSSQVFHKIVAIILPGFGYVLLKLWTVLVAMRYTCGDLLYPCMDLSVLLSHISL